MINSTTQSALIVIGIAWFLTQSIKATIIKIKTRQSHWFYTFLWRTGGMPSSHSALVSSLATYVGFIEGINSLIFAITFGFATIIVRDSLGIRRMVGKIIVRLNLLEKKLLVYDDQEHEELKEVKGHEPSEVVVGVVLGVCVGALFGVLA